MRSRARPDIHQGLLRSAEIGHVALPAHGEIALDDVAHKVAKGADACATAQGRNALLASVEADQKIIKGALIKDEKEESKLISVMKKQLGAISKLTPPQPTYFKHEEYSLVYLNCTGKKRKQPAVEQADKDLNVRLYANHHFAYTDVVLAHVPAEEYVAKANSYGFHGNQIQHGQQLVLCHS